MPRPLLLALLAALLAPPAAAERVLVADLRGVPPAEHARAVVLQGLANARAEGPAVFLITGERDPEWLDYTLRLTGSEAHEATLDELLEALRPALAGQILYDPAQPFTLDLATTAAALRQAVISTRDLGLPVLLDLRGRWTSADQAYRWAVETLLPECTPRAIAILPPGSLPMRDFAVSRRMLTLAPPRAPEDPAFAALLFQLPPGAAIYGEVPPALGPPLSRASHYLVPAAGAANLSYYARLLPEHRFYQYIGYLEPTAPRYLTLIFDYSDVGLALNHMPALWAHPLRGEVPLGWAIPAALAEAAPAALHWYYADAYRSGLDQFILGPSGAGEMDLASARAPYAFYAATRQAARQLGARASLYALPRAPSEVGPTVARFAADSGLRGVFFTGSPPPPPALYDGFPALAAPRVDSVEAAITFLNRLPLEQRFAALLLDPISLNPADAAHIAAHVAARFVVVPPHEIIELMRAVSPPPQEGTPRVAVTSLDYPVTLTPDEPFPVKAHISAPGPVHSAHLIYRPAASPIAFLEPMDQRADGFWAELPPLRSGGQFVLTVRASDPAGRLAWSPAVTIEIPRLDSDADGLSDAEEAFLLTDPHNPDTDGDGLSDALDPSPLWPVQALASYLGPVQPPSDAPYLIEAGGSRPLQEGREVPPGRSILYWLPPAHRPPGAPVVVSLEATGPAAVAISDDPEAAPEPIGEPDWRWYSGLLPDELAETGAFLRLACPPWADRPLIVRALGLSSPPQAPSIARIAHSPAHPGPGQPVWVSCLAFSPQGAEEVTLTYRVDGRGEVSIPMAREGEGERFHARIPAQENRAGIEFWITARDPAGREALSRLTSITVGAWSREVVSLLGARDFVGAWSSAPEWGWRARRAPAPGLRDSAAVSLTGGLYTVWVLAGGRGCGIALELGNERLGAIDPRRPDGWQRVARLRIEAGRHRVHLISESGPDAPPHSQPRYAAVIFSSDPTFEPPPGEILDVHNTLALLSPGPGETLSGRVDLLATGAGNMMAAEFSLDGELLRRVPGPPFALSLNTARLPNGPRLLRVEAVDRAGPTGLALELPITIAN